MYLRSGTRRSLLATILQVISGPVSGLDWRASLFWDLLIIIMAGTFSLCMPCYAMLIEEEVIDVTYPGIYKREFVKFARAGDPKASDIQPIPFIVGR